MREFLAAVTVLQVVIKKAALFVLKVLAGTQVVKDKPTLC